MEIIKVLLYIAAGFVAILFIDRASRKAQADIKGELEAVRKDQRKTTAILNEFHKFKTAFDHAYDAMFITDGDGTVEYINDSALRINGFLREEVIGSKAGKLWGGLMPKEYYTLMWHTIKTDRRPFLGRVTNKRKDGTKYQAMVSITPVFDPATPHEVWFIAVERDQASEESAITQ